MKIIAIVACKQKVCNAGILVRLPTRNARASQIVAVAILGPTYLRPWIIRSSSFVYCILSIELLMMNILSTPMAKTKNGITSALIIVNPMPRYAIIPIEETTEASTITIPIIAKVKPEKTAEGNWPIAIPM